MERAWVVALVAVAVLCPAPGSSRAEPAGIPPAQPSASPPPPAPLWKRRPLGSWLHFFTFDDQWNGRPRLEVFGIIQPSFVTTPATDANSFSFRRARLGLRGNLSDAISFFTTTELAAGPVTAPTQGGARLLDAAVNVRLSPFASVRAGQFIPYVSNILVPGAFVPWIDFTDIEKTVWLFNRQGDLQVSAARDIGLSVWSEIPLGESSLTYEVGAFNGTGLGQGEVDDNAKELTFAIRAAHGVGWSKLGYWTGWRGNAGDRLLRHSGALSVGWGDVIAGRLWFVAELTATREQQSMGNDVRSRGGYAAVGGRLHPRVLTAYRFALCDCNRNVGPPGPRDSQVHSFILGVHLHKLIRMLAQYDARFESNSAIPDGGADTFHLALSMPLRYAVSP